MTFTFLELFSLSTLIFLVVYSARAACQHQQGAKRAVLRAMVVLATLTLGIGMVLQYASDGHRYVDVRNILIAGIIACAFVIGAAVRLMKRSLQACDRRLEAPSVVDVPKDRRGVLNEKDDPLSCVLRFIQIKIRNLSHNGSK